MEWEFCISNYNLIMSLTALQIWFEVSVSLWNALDKYAQDILFVFGALIPVTMKIRNIPVKSKNDTLTIFKCTKINNFKVIFLSQP